MRTILSWVREKDERWFFPILACFAEIRFLNARTSAWRDETCHGLLLTGGSDIDAGFLKQSRLDASLIREPDPARDAWEFEMAEVVMKRDRPVFAICRGLQVLNVALGGSLLLDIPGHNSDPDDDRQPLRYERTPARRFGAVNSSHHQAIDQLGEGLVVVARHAEDGVIEQVEMPERRFVLGTQYHPERSPACHGLFDDFIEAVRAVPEE